MRVLLVLGLSALAAGAAGAAPALRQVQCVAPAPGCTHAVAVSRPSGVALSPDGRSVYVRNGVGSLGSLGVFARAAASGRLAQLQCVARRAKPCADGRGLETPAAVAVSPDGRSVYVAARNGRSVGIYRRLASGRLVAQGSVAGLAHPSALAVSPDGRSVYVGGDRLWTFARAPSGALQLVRADASPATALAVTRDGRFLYSAAGGGTHGVLDTWSRADDGTLSKIDELCSLGDACEKKGAGLLQPAALALTPDQSILWVAATVSAGVTAYGRAADGTLTSDAHVGNLPVTTDVAAAAGRVYVAYRDGLAVLPYDLQTREVARLPRATGVAVRGRYAYVVSSGRITVLRH